MGRRFQKADRARSVLRDSDSARVELRERDPRSNHTLVRGGLEVAQNPIVVCGDLAGGAAIVELLEKDRRRLAEGLSLRDEDGHRLGTAALTEQGGADRVIVTVSRQLREFTPQRAPIISKRLLDGSTLGGRTPALALRGLPELAERRDGLEVALIGRARSLQDRAHRVGLDPETSRVGRAGEELSPRVARARRGEEFGRRLGVAMGQL